MQKTRSDPTQSLRRASDGDVPALQRLIARSAEALSVGYYTPAQVAALVQYVFGVDTQLIDDGTYYVIEDGGAIVACGGWSRRATLFGGDQAKTGPDPLLDPLVDAARIRAFFVEPAMARRGLGRALITECVDAARGAGFKAMELVATLPGEPLYGAAGFAAVERFDLMLPNDVRVPVVRMSRSIE